MTKPNLLELPIGAQLVYLAEGGANVIYRIVSAKSAIASKKELPLAVNGAGPGVVDSSSVPPEFKGKLLRLRKDTPSGIPYQEIARNFDKNIRPLFKPEELVDQELVCLPRGLIQHCNDQLRVAEMDGKRSKRRQGVYLATTEPFGLLITDMTTFNDTGMALAELKPKWLLQSPSAPATARRCLRERPAGHSVGQGLQRPEAAGESAVLEWDNAEASRSSKSTSRCWATRPTGAVSG
ncbi:unnamed protein product [Aspergillus oryzae]|uniref:Inositol-pentakisphosphate 2-kinase n=2 Tax=Aspergillus oryzae TaxID=5062 RepID=A0AAN4YNV9_ASPOZ|nr:unnamed protein product [Aspergillus oryzae]GMF89376.1 unnamed protein product [Aspergillus oryzae]GMG08539.1 unnamed protein product [Aspergillus oryzae]GMG34236.1 unnamed protein product [Aspergillus oryzae]GMG53518.1 unnamed protein product [Aspergillus oryzae var. brunneus]